ncbi:bifunctional 2-polyprenyl-6-hydroxyphenol methylase/3-demethylubiquinol 3-O-methyltransferase UbiG [Niveispirillum sp.]|uniref:class I SAM-dependent methyltransferase n=1 Tax=Niveispirillum sp. TaxID=1917217 RepID=UPI001B6AEB51|nr:class I SAM-dependent methyltransferase [Niveispirillum sp.]MBP7335799.1 class I SAM-dependent methyltransferase [Niveispirillum sp.]
MAANPTLAHYSAHAALYADLLADHDSAFARQRFLEALGRTAPAILDLGCGAGRDLAGFRDAGARVTGADGSAALAAIAVERAQSKVHVLDLLSPAPAPWMDAAFDGIWAHHLFFHLPSPALPPILARLHGWLRPGGVFYACDPMGDGMEGMAQDGRHLVFRRPQSWKAAVRAAGFRLEAEWRRPEGLPRRQQDWLATLWRAEP